MLLAVVERNLKERDRFDEFQLMWSNSFHAHERQPGIPTADALARKAVDLPQR